MLRSSVSDFNDFANKVEEHIAAKVKVIKEEASIYMLQTKKEAEVEAEQWLQYKRSEWKQELQARERQEIRMIRDEVDQMWSAFKNKAQTRVEEKLKNRLEEQFPVLVECFIIWISQHYQRGIFFLPQTYSALVDTKKFRVEASRENAVIFRHDNLYIEYSVERIIEELQSKMVAMLHFEED